MTAKEKKAQRTCDEWNAANPIGTAVRYWRGMREGDPTGTGKIYNEATVMGGSPVAWISGCRGCVALTHVEVCSR